MRSVASLTVTLYVIRHARAGVRDRASLSDDLRPLDSVGQGQAQTLASVLLQADIAEVWSSPATRCLETVDPLVRALGLSTQVATELAEGSSSSSVLEFVRSLTGRNVVICSHGDIIPDMLRSLTVGGTRLTGSGCEKGSVWRLDNSTERIESGEYLGPLAASVED